MSKTKHQHAILGTIQVAVPFNPGDLNSAVTAEATIRAVAAGLQGVRVVDVATRLGKVAATPRPATEADVNVAQGLALKAAGGGSAPVSLQQQFGAAPQPDMPPIPMSLRK